jgi:alanine racemase
VQAEILIDRAALRANVRVLRAFVAPARFIAVVKANAYGHGLELVAPAIADLVDAFGVYEVSEASALRGLGISAPIHVLSAIPPQEFGAALEADVLFACWSQGAWLHDLLTLCARHERQARIQIKVETGLSRLGVTPREAGDLLAHLRAESRLKLSGAYSHLASAEELDSRYTMEQLATFEAAIPTGTVGQRHIAASAAAMLWPQTRLDAVRIGIALYGLWPSEGSRARLRDLLPLKPVLEWRSHLVSVREVAAETPVGYGCTYRPANETRIGVLPIGYAEGLPRALSNRGSAIVEGVTCPIVGRVCMNMAFIDLALAPKAAAGSRVTIVGTEGAAEISIDAIARNCETISYEIVARLPQQIPRSIVTE